MCSSHFKTDIRPMPTLLRLRLQLSTDFGNAEPSTQGLSCAQASDIGAPSAENVDFVGIKTGADVIMDQDFAGRWWLFPFLAGKVSHFNPHASDGNGAKRERDISGIQVI